MKPADRPYLTLAAPAECEIAAIKGSRFIGFAAPIADDDTAMVFLQRIKQRFPDARHWCWAYQLRRQGKTRFSDDGEPGGSAGKPILAPIVGRQLVDTMVVVVRYFGGVKLGVGGLVRAYSQAANAVLAEAQIITVTPMRTLKITYDYAQTAAVATALANLDLREIDPVYSDYVVATLQVPPEQTQDITRRLNDYTGGKIVIDTPEES